VVLNLGLYLSPISSLTRSLNLNWILWSSSSLGLLGLDSFRSPPSTQIDPEAKKCPCLARLVLPGLLTRTLIRDCAWLLTRVATRNLTRVVLEHVYPTTDLSRYLSMLPGNKQHKKINKQYNKLCLVTKQTVPKDATHHYECVSAWITWIGATVKKLLRFEVNRLNRKLVLTG
jgi:hypothetical protein